MVRRAVALLFFWLSWSGSLVLAAEEGVPAPQVQGDESCCFRVGAAGAAACRGWGRAVAAGCSSCARTLALYGRDALACCNESLGEGEVRSATLAAITTVSGALSYTGTGISLLFWATNTSTMVVSLNPVGLCVGAGIGYVGCGLGATHEYESRPKKVLAFLTGGALPVFEFVIIPGAKRAGKRVWAEACRFGRDFRRHCCPSPQEEQIEVGPASEGDHPDLEIAVPAMPPPELELVPVQPQQEPRSPVQVSNPASVVDEIPEEA